MARNTRKNGGKKTESSKLSSEDKTLWAHVSRNVAPQSSNRFTGFEDLVKSDEAPEIAPRPTQKAIRKRTQILPRPVGTPRARPADENLIFKEAVIPSVRQNVPGLDRSSSEKLRKGRLEIEGRVDLHGHTRKEAHSRLRSFLGSAHRQGKRCVLVITGKGSSVRQTDDAPYMSGSGKGILREEVPKWLAQPELRRLVLDYRTAQAKHGGEGALYILLKRTRR